MKKSQDADSGFSLTSLRVVAHSGGNHAQALALAAKSCGIPAEIVMPSNIPAVKIRAVKEYGATIHLHQPSEQVMSVC